jgi:hypothetical protein
MNMHNKRKNKQFNLKNVKTIFLDFVILKFNEIIIDHSNKDNSKPLIKIFTL